MDRLARGDNSTAHQPAPGEAPGGPSNDIRTTVRQRCARRDTLIQVSLRAASLGALVGGAWLWLAQAPH
jgi:hypothetical protein